MTHAKNIKPMKNLRTEHGGLAGRWLSRFADCFWIKNGTRVGVCSLSFAAGTMCFGGPGHPLYVHRVGAMAAAATVGLIRFRGVVFSRLTWRHDPEGSYRGWCGVSGLR